VQVKFGKIIRQGKEDTKKLMMDLAMQVIIGQFDNLTGKVK
jgi:hypothetical protein